MFQPKTALEARELAKQDLDNYNDPDYIVDLHRVLDTIYNWAYNGCYSALYKKEVPLVIQQQLIDWGYKIFILKELNHPHLLISWEEN